ncbi:MAG: hypothetical protein JWO38_4443 [Gemmataceae bacterium]|nr:hypothetical protein [Gemmataceae bacterium]
MANFVWVPVSGDNATDVFAYEISNSRAFRARVIPRADGTPTGFRTAGQWGDIAAGDKLIICGHGHATNTHVIGWKTAAGVVIWTHTQLAAALNTKLGAPQKAAAIQYELFVCWSADSILWRDPFACRLATDLKGHNCHGTVIGYKGSVVMYAQGRSIAVKGSGRITSWFGGEVSGPTLDGARQPTPTDPLYIDKFNYYDFSKQRRTWPIA